MTTELINTLDFDPAIDYDCEQSEALIGKQEPIPKGVHDIELSWDREVDFMRIIIGDKKWYFKEYSGKAIVTSTNNELGRIYLRGSASIVGDSLTMNRPPEASPHHVVSGMQRGPTLNRICYRRSKEDWRLYDENDGDLPSSVTFVNSYVGDMNITWTRKDRIAHVFHNGWILVDDNNIAHLYDEDLDYYRSDG